MMSAHDSEQLARMRRAGAWIFDMDGTLTRAVHDFDAIRVQLGLPAGRPILEALDALSEAEAAPKRAHLDALELDLARLAQPNPGARELLVGLRDRGLRLGVLTRNSRRNALVTLEAAGLLDCFLPEFVLGRDEAAPKPDPAGILHLLEAWAAPPETAMMVGDYRFDLEAGRAAGTATVHLDEAGAFAFGPLADLRVQTLTELCALVIA